MAQASLEDDWYAVIAIDERTFAIGEPRYHQRNWSYLMLGDAGALLFDTGSYYGDMTGVIARRIGDSPLTVLPSHMHYDHLGNVERFADIALPDLPVLRACQSGPQVQPREPLFLGGNENRVPPTFDVNRWLVVGREIDLGGRMLKVLHTPGHSPDSVSLWEQSQNRLFAADFLYPGELYAQVPGASLAAYLDAAQQVASVMDSATEIYGAHGLEGPETSPPLPLLGAAHLESLIARLRAVKTAPPSLAPGETETQAVTQDMALIIGAESLEGFAAS